MKDLQDLQAPMSMADEVTAFGAKVDYSLEDIICLGRPTAGDQRRNEVYDVAIG